MGRRLVGALFGAVLIATAQLAVNAAAPAAGTIVTNAGSVGTGPATSLGQYPVGVGVTTTDIYIGDFANPVLRDVNRSTGQETALAGNDAYGYSGDGGPATAAMIDDAASIAICGSTKYFADSYEYVIRSVDLSGTIQTVVGTGQPGYSGDGGPGTSARIGRVFGISCITASPGLLIADADNGAIRVLDGGGMIHTWFTGLRFPTAVIQDQAANTYVADPAQNVVWRVDGITNAVTILAGTGAPGYSGDGGSAVAAQLNQPWGLAVVTPSPTMPSTGCGCDVWISDSSNHRVRVVYPSGIVNTAVGTGFAGFSGDGGPPTSAQINTPLGLAADNSGGGHVVFVADSSNFRVRQVTLGVSPTINTVAGNGTPSLSGDGGPATSAQLGNPYAVAFDASGNEYVADNQNNVIRKITSAGVISSFAGTGVPGYSGDGGPATSAKLNDPGAVAVDGSGNVYISDTGNQRIRLVNSVGTITTFAGTGVAGFSGDGGFATGAMLNFPRGLAIAGGTVYIADTSNHRVRIVSAGIISTFAGNGIAGFSGDGGPATLAMLNRPWGVAIDGTGNVYFTDSANHRVRKVTTGTITTIAGNGVAGVGGDGGPATGASFNTPFGLAFGSGGVLYVADSRNNRVRLVDTNGNISTVVADCGTSSGFSGDGGPASIAQLNRPFGLGTDAAGDLFIADINNNRVRETSSLVGIRGSSCQASAGTAGSRSANAAPPGAPGPRFDSNGSTRLTVGALPSSLSWTTLQTPHSVGAKPALPQTSLPSQTKSSVQTQTNPAATATSSAGPPAASAASTTEATITTTAAEALDQGGQGAIAAGPTARVQNRLANNDVPVVPLALVPLVITALLWRLQKIRRSHARRRP